MEDKNTAYIRTSSGYSGKYFVGSQEGTLPVEGSDIVSGTYSSPSINYGIDPSIVDNKDNVYERVSALLNRVELVRAELAQLTSSVAELVVSIEETKHKRRTLSVNKDDSSINK